MLAVDAAAIYGRIGTSDEAESRRRTYAGHPYGGATYTEAISKRFGRHWMRGRPAQRTSGEPVSLNCAGFLQASTEPAGAPGRFADQLEKNADVKVSAKLPGWFKVPAPLGSYNPDGAVLIERDGTERRYFVVEAKSGLFVDGIRATEQATIQRCGESHYNALQ